MKLAEKIALVTSSSLGIGRAIAEYFAQEGADAVITYNRSPGGAEEALRTVEAAGRCGLVVKADLAKMIDIRMLVATAIEHFGRLDILVNNAGIETHAPSQTPTENGPLGRKKHPSSPGQQSATTSWSSPSSSSQRWATATHPPLTSTNARRRGFRAEAARRL